MRRNDLPKMTGCIGCGECCTVVNARRDEIKRIRHFIRDNGIVWQPPEPQPKTLPGLEGLNRYCGFLRPQEDGTFACAVYDVRPWVCRAFGVVTRMVCTYSPEEAKFDLSPAEISGRHLGSAMDPTLGEVFEGPGYVERIAPYLEATSQRAALEFALGLRK